MLPLHENADLFEPRSRDVSDIGEVDARVCYAFVGAGTRNYREHGFVSVTGGVSGDHSHPNFLSCNHRNIARDEVDGQWENRVSAQCCHGNNVGVLSRLSTLFDAGETEGGGVHFVGGDIRGLGKCKVEQQCASVVVGPVRKRQVGQAIGRCVVVEIVDGCNRCLGQIGEVHVAFEVVNGHGDKEFNIRSNQVGHAVGEGSSLGDIEGVGEREFDWVCSLVDPLLVEGETPAGIRVGAEDSVGKGQVGHRSTGDPNGVGGEVLNR